MLLDEIHGMTNLALVCFFSLNDNDDYYYVWGVEITHFHCMLLIIKMILSKSKIVLVGDMDGSFPGSTT